MTMEILPILAALRRNSVGAVLVGLQLALTLAIVCNALFVIDERMQRMRRPSGLDEANTITLDAYWVGEPTDLKGRQLADLAALRALPGVVAVAASNSYPLSGSGSSFGANTLPNQPYSPLTPRTTSYVVGDQAPEAWNLKLVAGRWFRPEEAVDMSPREAHLAPVVVVTRALANELFPDGQVLGRQLYIDGPRATTIVGVVDRLQTPWAGNAFGEPFVENAALFPGMTLLNYSGYVIRTAPGQRDNVLRAVEPALRGVDPGRLIQNLKPFAETRVDRYSGYRASNIVLTTVSALLLAVAALGIVGLTSYWVGQRRRHIGIRRALGARRIDIMAYFHTENLLIAGFGAAVGAALAIAVNLWMVSSLELTRMSPFYVLVAAVVVVLSQAAVFVPALRAAAIPPALATRGG